MNLPSLLTPEGIAHWLATGFYLLAGLWFLRGLMRGVQQQPHEGRRLLVLGFLLHALSLALQWQANGYGPYLHLDESLSSLAWGGVLAFLLLSHKVAKLKSLGVVLLPCVIAVMMVRLFASAQPGTPPMTFSGLWFILHVATIKLAMVAFLIAFCAAILYLLKGSARGEYCHRLPPLEVLDTYNHRYTGWAFVFWGAMIVFGALWAEQSWGRYWGWDTIETWSLISWLLLGLLLHLRRFLGWRGKRAAWAILGCFAVSILTMFLLPLFLGSVHSDYLRL